MEQMKSYLVVLALLPVLVTVPSCPTGGSGSGKYTKDTFEFVHSRPPQQTGESVPHISIDTNTRASGPFGGTITSSLPCSVRLDYTDNHREYQSLVVTSIRITYGDDQPDATSEVLKRPQHIAAREYESVNSLSGGQVVRSKDWILSGELPKLITRLEPFRIQLEGHFTKEGSPTVPFTIDQQLEPKIYKSDKPAGEYLLDN